MLLDLRWTRHELETSTCNGRRRGGAEPRGCGSKVHGTSNRVLQRKWGFYGWGASVREGRATQNENKNVLRKDAVLPLFWLQSFGHSIISLHRTLIRYRPHPHRPLPNAHVDNVEALAAFRERWRVDSAYHDRLVRLRDGRAQS